MKSILLAIFSLLLLQGSALRAQGVYVTAGEKGPVFSDKPQPGDREVILPPLNVVTPPTEAKPVGAAVPVATRGDSASHEAQAPAYRSFSVVQPENYGSVLANTALFEVRVAVDPPLQLALGHAFSVSINGRPVGQRFTASEFMVPPEFWGDTVPSSGQSLQLDASIVDRDGRELSKAEPVRFYMRYAPPSAWPRRSLPPGPPRPPRPPIPRSPPALERAVGATTK
jgi:hypothetical protein